MPVDDRQKKEFVKAKLEARKASKTKDALPPIKRKEYDPENALLSKAEFEAKYRKIEEDEAEARSYIAKKREAKKEDQKEDPVPTEAKRGRPKKVE